MACNRRPSKFKKFMKRAKAPFKGLLCPQRIVIPKGLLKPFRTAVIQIPDELLNSPVVVAMPSTSAAPAALDAPPSPEDSRRTYERSSQYLQDGSTFGFDTSPCKSPGTPRKPPTPEYNTPPIYVQRSPDYSTTLLNSWESGFDPSNEDRRKKRGFKPYVDTLGVKQNLSLYRDFKPPAVSSAPGANKMEPWNRTQIVSPQKSYLRAPTPRSPGVGQRVKTLPNPLMSPENTSAAREVMFMLDRLEVVELGKIQKDLRDLQSCRRKLVFDVSSLSGGGTDSLNESSYGSAESGQSDNLPFTTCYGSDAEFFNNLDSPRGAPANFTY